MAIGRPTGAGGDAIRIGRDIELALDAGGKASGYHAAPASGRGRGVLVLDEDGALSDFARSACQRLARAGFAALAPDVADLAAAAAPIDSGVQYLLDDAATDGGGVGVLGFGLGGVLALEAGARHRRVRCAVDFYGLPEGDAPYLQVPALLIFGEQDARIALGEARELESGLASARLRLEPDAGEGFMNDARPDRHAAAAAAAGWDAAIAFLGAAL